MQATKTAKTASTGTKTATKAKKKAGLRVSPWAIPLREMGLGGLAWSGMPDLRKVGMYPANSG